MSNNNEESWLVPLQDWLGVPASEIPLLDLFLDTSLSAVRHATSTRAPREGSGSNDPHSVVGGELWTSHLWSLVTRLGAQSDFEPVVAELAVLEDDRRLGEGEALFFVSNIVCKHASPEPFLLRDAYLKALDVLRAQGSLLLDHVLRNALCICIRGRKRVAYDARGEEGVYLGTKQKITNLLRPESHLTDEQIRVNCSTFFSAFLDRVPAAADSPGESYYILVPFERPEKVVGAQNQKGDSFAPGGAIVVIFNRRSSSKTTPPIQTAITDFAVRLRYMLTMATLRESSRFLDVELLRDAQMAKAINAFNEMGHALRPLVSATGYTSAARGLDEVMNEPGLTPVSKKRVANALRALHSFEHVEAFGSLLRVNAWLDSEGGYSPQQVSKQRACFDVARVKATRDGQLDAAILDGYSELVVRLARGLASTFKIEYLISRTACDGMDVTTVIPDDPAPYRALTEIDLPPLSLTAAKSTLLLGILIGLLEPMRNAAAYLNGHATLPKTILVLLRITANHECSIYIGNTVRPADMGQASGRRAASGVLLTSGLLERSSVGRLRAVEVAEYSALEQCVDHGKLAGAPMTWICADFSLLQLFQQIEGDSDRERS
jgi:hypothetical protein